MAKAIPVGRSDRRTEAKHDYLSQTLGREIGAAPHAAKKLSRPYRRHVLIDLTAGDGIEYEDEGPWPHSTSAGIFARHGAYDKAPVPVPVHILLCERAPATFASLTERLEANLPDLGYWPAGQYRWTSQLGRVELEARCLNSRELPCSWGDGDFVFLNNDPNNIHDWALPDCLADATARGAVIRSFNTMGCNPNGIKRLPPEIRARWYDHISQVAGALLPYQDLTLLAIDRDAAQWAYLVNEPSVWVDRDVTRARSIFGNYGMTVTDVTYRRDRAGFRQQLDRLFLTDREREEGGDDG